MSLRFVGEAALKCFEAARELCAHLQHRSCSREPCQAEKRSDQGQNRMRPPRLTLWVLVSLEKTPYSRVTQAWAVGETPVEELCDRCRILARSMPNVLKPFQPTDLMARKMTPNLALNGSYPENGLRATHDFLGGAGNAAAGHKSPSPAWPTGRPSLTQAQYEQFLLPVRQPLPSMAIVPVEDEWAHPLTDTQAEESHGVRQLG